MLDRRSKLCSHFAVGKGGGVGKWVIASGTLAKDRHWVLHGDMSPPQETHREGCFRACGGGFLSKDQDSVTSYFAVASFIRKKAGSGSQGLRKAGQPSSGRGSAPEPTTKRVHIRESMCMPWCLRAAGPLVAVCCGSGTGQPLCLHVSLSKCAHSHVRSACLGVRVTCVGHSVYL